MSVDILLNSTSRRASLTSNSGQPQTKAEGQGHADPAKPFSSLLETSQGKVENDASARTDDADMQDEAEANPIAVFAPPQNLLSLAGSSPDLKVANHNFATGNIAQNDKNTPNLLSALIKEANPEGGEKQAGEQPSAHARSKKGPAPKTPLASTKSEQTISQAIPKATDDAPAEKSGVDLVSRPKSDKGQARQLSAQLLNRADIQPQLTAKSNTPANIKAATVPSQAATRIADIQVVSERSFGTVKTLQIKLDPAELGAVTARIRVASEGVEVHLVAEKTHGAEALAADRPMIEKALKAAGIGDDAKISVTISERNAAGAVQQVQASQNASQQQAFNMQQGFDGRSGTQAGFMGGEGRRNDESGQTGQERSGRQTAQDGGNGTALNNDRNRGLVV